MKDGNQVRMFIVVLRGYMWFPESKTNLATDGYICKPFQINIFIKNKYCCSGQPCNIG